MKLDWEKIKPDVQRLYKNEDKTLAEVMTLIKQMHGFQASSAVFPSTDTNFADDGIVKDLTKSGFANGVSRRIILTIAAFDADKSRPGLNTHWAWMLRQICGRPQIPMLQSIFYLTPPRAILMASRKLPNILVLA